MPILGRNTRKIHLISYNLMGNIAFWMASFQCLAKSQQSNELGSSIVDVDNNDGQLLTFFLSFRVLSS